LLVENPLKRHSIGSSTPGLKTTEDASLTIDVSADCLRPPVPSGRRCAATAPEIINGTYKQPPYIPSS
jgi:hypothetical protein